MMAVEAEGSGTNTQARPGPDLWPRLFRPDRIGPADEHLTPGSGSPLRWIFSSIWLVYLIQPIADLFGHHHGAWYTAGGLVIAVAFCVIYAPVITDVDLHPMFARYGLGVIIVLSAVACTIYGQDWLPLWIYVSAATGQVIAAGPWERKVTLLSVLGVCVLYSIFSWISHFTAGNYLALLLPILLIGWAMMGFRLQIQLMHQLAQARDTVAKLATNEERLRLARDMHDLTGQSLSMITLKSELAAKRLARLPQSPERDAIMTELGDISQVSRQTLHDIREAVSGYRRPTLAIEVITARTALEAAGIQLDDDPQLITSSGSFDPEAEAALAWCLREAVTNVLRHSGAKTCRIRLTEGNGEYSLDIGDDGQGFTSAGPSTGSGLRNMSERLSAVGGRLVLSPVRSPGSGPAGVPRPIELALGSRGFRLTAIVPASPAGDCPGGDSPAGDCSVSP
jgi:two-component system, NarL family, sensor histidine kinase DesK